MVTGKDDARILYAKKSVENFIEQSYNPKVLVILNHHNSKRVLDQSYQYTNIFEFHVDKTENTTLGDLRNISLQLVPYNARWTTWDDDDYRHPSYLQTLADYALDNHTISVISQRIDYNSNNDMSWVCKKTNGLVFFLAPFDNRLKYLRLNSMEDTDILNTAKKLGYSIKIVQNDPRLYVRVIHSNNTSLYIKPNRDYLVYGQYYSERFTTTSEKQFIKNIKHKLRI
jgi:hypothetical protein